MSTNTKRRRQARLATPEAGTSPFYPKKLRALKQWIVYRLVPSPDRPGKKDKIPYRDATHNASHGNPEHWHTYKDARALMKEHGFDGLGFVFRKGGKYTGVDLDGCREPETGKIAPWAKPILEQFASSFTELSQSGAGFHIIVEGKLPKGSRHVKKFPAISGGKQSQIEVYDQERFFALTGNVYKGRRTISRKQKALSAVVAQYLTPTVKGTTVDLPVRNRHMQDAEVLAKTAALNPSEFHRLFDAGETRPGKSESESDYQLACMFARIVGGNVECIERLMRRSALVRDKWDEHQSYLTERTIARAIETVGRELAPTLEDENSAQRRYYASLKMLEEHPELLVRPAPLARYVAWPGRATLFAGREKKGGKSTLLSAAVAAVTRGVDFLGLSTCKKPGKVLWISADLEHEGDIYNRLKHFKADLSRVALIYPQAEALPDRLIELDSHIDLDAPTWVIIDTLSNFARVKDPYASTEWPETILHVKRHCRERDIAATFAHHTGKHSNEYRDSTSIGATVDQITHIHEADAKHYTRNDRRMETLGRASGYEETHVTLDDGCYRITVHDKLALGDRIQAYLADNPGASQRTIEKEIGGDNKKIRDTLKFLVETERVTKSTGAHGANCYALVGDLEEESE